MGEITTQDFNVERELERMREIRNRREQRERAMQALPLVIPGE